MDAKLELCPSSPGFWSYIGTTLLLGGNKPNRRNRKRNQPKKGRGLTTQTFNFKRYLKKLRKGRTARARWLWDAIAQRSWEACRL
jgi:hypothetical protein